jgi:hypothetical protein
VDTSEINTKIKIKNQKFKLKLFIHS